MPYQFDLFQQCRRALSTHNAFQGKHASVGERSMLGVFQQVIQKVEKQDEKSLVSFDLMFEGIRNELKGEIQSSVILAEKNLKNTFAIQVLKVLFLVKYFSNFKTTKRNIAVLLINNINVDVPEHNKAVEEALNTLENQNYAQRNGEVYEFLTDAEKDVEEEIKSTNIDEQAVTQLLKQLFFEEIIRDNKIKYLGNKQDYDFAAKVDGIVIGKDKELTIEIITENSHEFDNEQLIKNNSMGNSSLIFRLGSNATFIKDLRMYLKTDKYVKQNQTTSNRTEVKRILQDKAQLNAERRRSLILIANKDLATSVVYMNGDVYQASQTTEGKTKVVNAFQDFIKTVYANLRMLGKLQFDENSIKNALSNEADELYAADSGGMSEAEREVLSIIDRRKAISDRTTLNDLKNYLTKKPYGWYSNAIWSIVAKLYKRGKLEVKQDSNVLEGDEVLDALLRSSNYTNTLLETQADIDPKQVKKLLAVYTDAFDESSSLSEPKDIAQEFKEKLKGLLVEVNQYLVQKREYPFLSSLTDFKGKLEEWCKKDYNYFINSITSIEDELLDAKDDLLDPIKRFMNGDQIAIYDSIRKMLDGDTSNFNFIDGDELDILKALMINNAPYKGNAIKEAKQVKDALTKKVLAKIEQEKVLAEQDTKQSISILKSKEDFTRLTETQQNKIIEPLEKEMDSLSISKYIGNIKNTKARVTGEVLTKQLNEMVSLVTPVLAGDSGLPAQPKIHYIKSSAVKPTFNKSELRNDTDVDEYVELLREEMKDQIKNNRRIQL